VLGDVGSVDSKLLLVCVLSSAGPSGHGSVYVGNEILSSTGRAGDLVLMEAQQVQLQRDRAVFSARYHAATERALIGHHKH
jgi:hypothetical protein